MTKKKFKLKILILEELVADKEIPFRNRNYSKKKLNRFPYRGCGENGEGARFRYFCSILRTCKNPRGMASI